MRHRAGLLPLITVGVLACGPVDQEEAHAPFQQWDSAGITISLAPDSSWTDVTRWRIGANPELVLGTVDGRDPHTAFGRVGDVEVLSDGRIVVEDWMAREIRVFDPEGRHLTTLGGEGQGPTEFLRLDRIAVLNGDSIVGRDVGIPKHVIFAPDGSGSRTVTGPSMDWNGLTPVYVAGWLADASAIVSHSPQPSDYSPGRSLVTAEWHIFDPLGNPQVFVGRLPSVRVNNEGEGAGPLSLSGRARIQPDSSGFWYGFPERLELVHYTASGIDRILRTTHEPPLVTEALRESYRDWMEESARTRVEGIPPSLRYLIEARVEQLAFADRLPAYRRFLVSNDGYFWLEHYETVQELLDPSFSWDDRPASTQWTVLSSDGRWLGTINIPEGFSLRVIAEDRILGLRTDELDVQYVVAYELVKPD